MERDPETGGRKIEEIAFEVADTESTAHATKKARKIAMRGVRRLFYVRVEDRAVHEWQHDTDTRATRLGRLADRGPLLRAAHPRPRARRRDARG